jgi:hypothetical protein
MWTEELTKDCEADLSIDCLRTWWREIGLPRAMDKTGSFDCTSVNQVLKNKLYIGCEIASSKLNQTHPEIKAVVSLGSTKYRQHEGIVYHHITIQDDESSDLLQHLDEAVDFIHSHEKVFVHCQAGISRSASVCMAYLIKYHKMNVNQAYQTVANVRPIICPNPGFLKQLYFFYKSRVLKC